MSKPRSSLRTLRDFNFEKCEHPADSIAFDREPQHCGFCGAIRKNLTEYEGGSIDYKIDLVVLAAYREQLEKNIPPEA